MDVLDSLTSAMKELEGYYLNITAYYPPLLKYLECHIANMTNRNRAENHSCPNNVVGEGPVSQKAELQTIHNNQLLIAEQIKKIVQNGIKHNQDIVDIRDFAQDLELYSLNAMVSAIKSGKNAGAFPYITKEIQKVSVQSFDLSQQLMKKGSLLISLLQKIEDSINCKTDKQSRFITRIKQAVDLINDDIEKNNIDFNDYTETTEKTYSCLNHAISRIITEVQKQDIFKQSIDHILLSFQQTEYSTLDTQENKLTYHKYYSELYDFSANVVNEIELNLKQSISVFEGCHKDIRLLIQMDTRFEALKTEISNNVSELTGLRHDIEHSISDFMTTYEGVSQLKKTTNITNDIGELIKDLNDNIGRVELINMSNKIEITRNDEIPGIREAIRKIGDSSNKISEKVTILHNYMTETSKQMRKSMNDYHESTDNCSIFIIDYCSVIKDDITLLIAESDDLIDQINKMIVFSNDLNRLDENLIQDIQKTKRIQETLAEISRLFKDQSLIFGNNFKDILNESKYDSWNIEKRDIEELLEKFTIFTHKEAFFGENLEDSQGAMSGEITLF